MNFTYIPELGMRYGYFVVLTPIAGICFGLHALFRHNDWL